MLYEIAHFIKDKLGFIWNLVEAVNGWAFAILYGGKLRTVNGVLASLSNDYEIRQTTLDDVDALVQFFNEQPEYAFEFFHPHEFDAKSVRRIVKNKAFQTFVVVDKNAANQEPSIVGYFFLRSFVNGKCFRGRMADFRTRGRGIGKLMAQALEKIAVHEGLRMFASISPDNLASLNSAKAVSDVKIIKTLDNGYYYIECTPKE